MDVNLSLKLSKAVHEICKDVPHDIGITLEQIVREHQTEQFNKHDVSGKRPSLQDVKDNIANIQGFASWETCFNQHILQAAVPELMDLLAIHYQAACASGAAGTVAEGRYCDYCKGSGYDPYPNHDTTQRPCPKCEAPSGGQP